MMMNIVNQSKIGQLQFYSDKAKKDKKTEPYSENEIWDRDELLSIIKYEPYKRNKAALALFWDLDARNHEITLLKKKNIILLKYNGSNVIIMGVSLILYMTSLF